MAVVELNVNLKYLEDCWLSKKTQVHGCLGKSNNCPAGDYLLLFYGAGDKIIMFQRPMQVPIHSCFVEKYIMRASQWENDFNTFFAYTSQYIMIFWTPQQCWGMFLVLGGHPVNIGDGYW